MFTTDLVNLYNIFKTSLYIYIFQDEKCRLMRNLSLSHGPGAPRMCFVRKVSLTKSVSVIHSIGASAPCFIKENIFKS